jgi:DNA-K related protein
LAVLVERRMMEGGATKLTLAQRQTLRRKCSAAKEQLLSDASVDRVRITVLGAGRGVVSGGVTADLSRDEVVRAVSDGFLPLTAASDLPARDRRAGLRELGLPYESEPAITRHLAAFLTRAGAAAGLSSPMAPARVLFNGGFFAPALARERVIDALAAWFGNRPDVLENDRPEAAVAVGAAFYGRLRQNPDAARRLLIRAGSARSYYVGVQAAAGPEPAGSAGPVAVCVMPRGTQEGSSLRLEREFTVMTNRPVAFTLYSTTQRADSPNDIVTFADPDEVRAHAPLVTALRYGKRSRRVPIGVRLAALFTETGTLELWCESLTTDHRWKLSFNLRASEGDPLSDVPDDPESADEPDRVIVDDAAVERAVTVLRDVLGQTAREPRPDALVGELENILGHGKHAWPLPVIRRLSDALLTAEPARRAAPEYEMRWLNLVGFCTRPGFGTPLDNWRVSELRKVYAAGLAFPKDIQNQVEWLVLWQRVGAGFSTGQQRELAQRVMGQLGIGQKKPPRINPQIEREGWRLLASLERLDAALRTRLGDEMLVRLRREPRNGSWPWVVGRFGSRIPLYGPLSSVVPPATAGRWIDALLSLKVITGETAAAVAQVGALTGDAARELHAEARQAAIERLQHAGYTEELLGPLLALQVPDRAEAVRAFGESLPEGLVLKADG